MALSKVTYADGDTVIGAKNLNDIQDEIIAQGTGKQDTISDLDTIRSGAAAGASAVQKETDPTVPKWAKETDKPAYTAKEITSTDGNVQTDINLLKEEATHVKDMTSAEEQTGAYAGYHLGFYLDENGDLCQVD